MQIFLDSKSGHCPTNLSPMPFDVERKIPRALAKEWLEIRGLNAAKHAREQYLKLSLKHFPSEFVDSTKFQEV